MKVSVQNHNKPLPFIGAAIQGLTNVLGGGISAVQNAAQSERQMQHDIMMAQLNQHYNVENMETQNRYQVEQWQRENEYNDPSAVAARYRNAGISPQAALGGSASGAGISGGLSSAPSGSGNMGSASSLPHVNSFADIGAGLTSAMRVDVQNKQDAVVTEGKQIENKIKEIVAQYKETELVTQLQDLRTDIEVKKSKVRNNDSLIKVYDSQIKEIDARIERMNKQNEESDAHIAQTKQEVKESGKRIEQINEDIKLKHVLRDKENELINLTKSQVDLNEKELEKKAVEIYHIYIKMGLDATTALKNVNDIITDWVPAPGKIIKKVTEVVHKSAKK